MTDAMNDIAAQMARVAAELHEQAATEFLQAHGRWPEFTYEVMPHLLPPYERGAQSTTITITVQAGDVQPPGTIAKCWGVFNERQLQE